MRLVERVPVNLDSTTGRPFRFDPKRKAALATWLQKELENAISDQQTLARVWTQAKKDYYCVPESEIRDVPYLKASNRVAPVAQIASDAIFATVFSITTEASPIITVKATNDAFKEHTKAIQLRIDHELNSEGEATVAGRHWNFLPSLYHGGKDAVKLGTGVWHIEWTEQVVKGRYTRVESSGARIEPIPLENILVPGGSGYDLQNLPWVAIMYPPMSAAALHEKGERLKWDVDGCRAMGNITQQQQERERFSRQYGNASREDVYDIYRIYCCYDIDGDGETEDLLVTFNLTGTHIAAMDWQPYDHRPLVMAHFDIEEFLFYGRGVPSILRTETGIATDALNNWIDNSFLANCRMYKGTPGALAEDTVLAWPGRYISSTDPEKLGELTMSDVYPSLPALFQVAMGLAERATGINDLSTPRPSQVLGSRTPGITALSLLQQTSQRHTPFFASFRSAAACAVRECLYREQERLLRGDTRLPDYLVKILGSENAALYIEALTSDEFDNSISIELTVTSAQMNKEVERQNAILLANIYRQYVTELVQAVILVSNPQVPPALRSVVEKAILATNEFMEKLLRTFSDVSNPGAFIIDPVPELQQLAAQPINPIAQLLSGLQGGGLNGVAGATNGASNGTGESG